MSVRVLICCEMSGRVRNAFAALGAEAWSCDLLPSETPGNHIQASIWSDGILEREWDALIYHWPCTRLCNSGVRWLYGGKGKTPDVDRWREMVQDAEAFKRLLNLPIRHIAGENPIMHRYAKEIVGVQQSQIIQPWQFGHGEVKATCLWLKNLPCLVPTEIVSGRTPRVHHASPGPDRWKERSRTLPGIAKAFAAQWLPIISKTN